MSAGHVVGVDIGGTKLLAGAVGPGLEVAHQTRRDVWNVSLAALVDAIANAIEEIAAAVGPVEAVGLGVPCTIDRRTGIAVQAVHLPITDVHLAAVVGERVGVPVVVDNDANCAVLAEARFGVARGLSEVVLLTLGTGIGGGLVLGGELYRGAVGAGAEMGHMVIDMDGPPCQGNCPNRGCLEALASGTALVREAALRVARRPDTPLGLALEEGELLTGVLVTELAFRGDPVARDAIETVGRRLGVGLSSLVNIFNPEMIVIGGGVIAAGELLLAPARAELAARALAPGRDLVRVEAAAFGPEAGMIGAALMAREEAVAPSHP